MCWTWTGPRKSEPVTHRWDGPAGGYPALPFPAADLLTHTWGAAYKKHTTSAWDCTMRRWKKRVISSYVISPQFSLIPWDRWWAQSYFRRCWQFAGASPVSAWNENMNSGKCDKQHSRERASWNVLYLCWASDASSWLGIWLWQSRSLRHIWS